MKLFCVCGKEVVTFHDLAVHADCDKKPLKSVERRKTVRRSARATDKVRHIDDGMVVPSDGYGQHSHPDFFAN
jgi:hypothetical protein